MANDIQDFEKQAAIYAGQMGGEYLNSINQVDLSKLTDSQWETFVEVICMNFIMKRVELQPVPF